MSAAGVRPPACEPVQLVGPVIPLDQWPHLPAARRRRPRDVGIPSRLRIPRHLEGFKTGGYCQDVRWGWHWHHPGSVRLEEGPLLSIAERVGDSLVAMIFSSHFYVLLISRRRGTVLQALRIRGVITGDPNGRFVEEAVRAKETAERAVLMLREQHAPRPGRRLLEAEAWLRRQLAGLEP